MPRIGRSFPVPPRVTKGPLGAGPTTAIMRAPRANRRVGPQRPLKGFFLVTPPPQPITEVTPRANRRAGPTKAKPGFVVVAPPSAQVLQRTPTLPVKRQPVPRQQPPRTFIAPQVPALLVRVSPGILAPKPRQPILRQRVPRVYVTPPAAAGFRIRLPMVGVGR
jgi:hypothetical protein